MPVLQAVVATTKRAAWLDSPRGLGAADLAMHVVLPELDGRVLAGVIAFKDPSTPLDGLAFTGMTNRPEPDRIDAVADRVAALVRSCRSTPRDRRRIAVLMPDYPGAPGRTGYAVGLDVPASVNALCSPISPTPGYAVAEAPTSSKALLDALEDAARHDAGRVLSRPSRRRFRRRSAKRSRRRGATPETDPDVSDGAFRFRAKSFGNVIVALAARSRPHRRAAAPTITIRPCRRATRCWPSALWLVTSPVSMPSSTWARTARWNGCRARPWR